MSKQAPNMNSVGYSLSLLLNVLKFCSIYHGAMLKGTFIENVHESICHRMRAYWGIYKKGMVQQLPHYATPLTNLEFGSASPAITSSPTQTQRCTERRQDRSNQNVIVPDASVTNAMNSSPTNIDRVMGMNSSRTAKPSRRARITRNSTTVSGHR